MGGKRGGSNMASQPKRMFSAVSALALVLAAWMARSPGVVADESDARRLLKAMADYVGAQQAIAFDYDAILEVVTKDRQKLQLVSSGMVSLARPDKIRTTRSGGFVDIETVFDGKTLTLFGKNKNIYTRVEVPGSLDNLVNELHREVRTAPARCRSVPHPCPRRDDGRRDGRQGPWQRGRRRRRVRLLRLPRQGRGLADLGDAGRETASVPVRHHVHGNRGRAAVSPVQLRNWKSGSEVATQDFTFKPPSGAKQISIDELKAAKDMGELPSHFVVGGK